MTHHCKFEVTSEFCLNENVSLRRLVLINVDQHECKLTWSKLYSGRIVSVVVLNSRSLLLYNHSELFSHTVNWFVQVECQEHVRDIRHVSTYT